METIKIIVFIGWTVIGVFLGAALIAFPLALGWAMIISWMISNVD